MSVERKTLRQLRAERQWSREYVAVQVGVSLSTISNLETGRHRPRMDLAEKLAALFGVPLGDIEWVKYEGKVNAVAA